VEVSETANNDRLMHAVRRHVHLRLVSTSLFQPLPPKAAKANTGIQCLEQLLQLVPASRKQTRHHVSQLRAQRFLPDLLHLQPYLWPVSTPQPPRYSSSPKSNTHSPRQSNQMDR
jgi:hypothetical protein